MNRFPEGNRALRLLPLAALLLLIVRIGTMALQSAGMAEGETEGSPQGEEQPAKELYFHVPPLEDLLLTPGVSEQRESTSDSVRRVRGASRGLSIYHEVSPDHLQEVWRALEGMPGLSRMEIHRQNDRWTVSGETWPAGTLVRAHEPKQPGEPGVPESLIATMPVAAAAAAAATNPAPVNPPPRHTPSPEPPREIPGVRTGEGLVIISGTEPFRWHWNGGILMLERER